MGAGRVGGGGEYLAKKGREQGLEAWVEVAWMKEVAEVEVSDDVRFKIGKGTEQEEGEKR